MEALQKYAANKIEITRLTAENSEIAPEVSKAVTSIVGQKCETELGLFYFSIKRKYKYSDNVKKLEAELKAAKKEEEKTVDFDETKVLNFKAS